MLCLSYQFCQPGMTGFHHFSPSVSDVEASAGRLTAGSSGCLFGLQLPDHLQRVVDVLADMGHGIENVPDRALTVDDIGDPAGQQAEHRRYPVALADATALVAEQGERQLVPIGEGCVLAHGV